MVRRIVKKPKRKEQHQSLSNGATATQCHFYVLGPKEETMSDFCSMFGVLQAIVICSTESRAKKVVNKMSKDLPSVMLVQEDVTPFHQGDKRVLVGWEGTLCLEEFPRVPLLVNYDQPSDTTQSNLRLGDCSARKTITINFIEKEEDNIFELQPLPVKAFEFLWDFIDEANRLFILKQLSTSILPNMKEPILLCDFVKLCVDKGGLHALYSLQGLHYLMLSHNLAYPEFYRQLYGLFSVDSLHTDYAQTFILLLSRFLSSTVLSGKLVASFIKRGCRLSLHAPSHLILPLLTIIHNLFKRHPNTLPLLHRVAQDANAQKPEDDPYDVNCKDPLNTGAMYSSCWELKILQQHCHHNISSFALLFSKPLGNNNRERDVKSKILADQTKEFVKQLTAKPFENTGPLRTTFHGSTILFDPQAWDYEKSSSPWQAVWSFS